MLSDRLSHTIKDTLQIIELCCQLYFNNDDASLRILGLDVNTIELVIDSFLVAFTFQNLLNLDFLSQENGNQSFQHIKVSLVAKHPLHGPVKSYVLLVNHHNSFLCFITSCLHSLLNF